MMSERSLFFFHALLEQKHAGCSSFNFFFFVVGTNTLVDFLFQFLGLFVSFLIAHFALYLSGWDSCLSCAFCDDYE
jgi:hypothetical protein